VTKLPSLQRLRAEDISAQPETYDALSAARPTVWLRGGYRRRPADPVARTPGT
jgi:hypothetical protein